MDRHHCNLCRTSFSVLVGTMFESSTCELWQWFAALFILGKTDREITARKLGAAIDVNKDTAVTIMMRIQETMLADPKFIPTLMKEMSKRTLFPHTNNH